MGEGVIQRVTLSNGLRIRFLRRKGEIVAVHVRVRVGSGDDPPGLEGISHFVEHTLCTGKRQLIREIEEVGGAFDASVSEDGSVYCCTIGKEHFELALRVLSKILKTPTFGKTTIEKERKAILAEIRGKKDSPLTCLFDLLKLNLFQKNPAKNPGCGTEKSVRRIKLGDLARHHKKHYVAGNMSLNIVGDVNLAKVKKHFGDIPAGSVKRQTLLEPPLNETRVVREKGRWGECYLIMGFRFPPVGHREYCVTDILFNVLGGGVGSRLGRRIRLKGLAYDVEGGYDNGRDWGALYIFIGAAKKNIPRILSIIKTEIRKKVSVGEMKRAREQVIGDILRFDSSNHLAMFLWKFEDYGMTLQEFLKAVKGTTLGEVNAAMEKYLRNHVLVLVPPR